MVAVFCANASDKEANTLELPLTQAGFNYKTVVNIVSQEMARKEVEMEEIVMNTINAEARKEVEMEEIVMNTINAEARKEVEMEEIVMNTINSELRDKYNYIASDVISFKKTKPVIVKTIQDAIGDDDAITTKRLEYAFDAAEYGLKTAEYAFETAEYGLKCVDDALKSAEHALESVEHALEITEYALKSAEHALESVEYALGKIKVICETDFNDTLESAEYNSVISVRIVDGDFDDDEE